MGCGGEFCFKDEMSRAGIGVSVVSDEDELSESRDIDVAWSEKGRIFQESNINSDVGLFDGWVVALVLLLCGGIANKDTLNCPWIKFSSQMVMHMNKCNTSKHLRGNTTIEGEVGKEGVKVCKWT